jgi:hypothetical protein
VPDAVKVDIDNNLPVLIELSKLDNCIELSEKVIPFIPNVIAMLFPQLYA